MSTVTELSCREAEPVDIGGATVYCESFKISSERSVSEEPTADGGSVVTNNSSRSTKLIFTGRVCTDGSPEDFIYSFNSLVRSASAFNVSYMDLLFSDCRMLSYSFEDKGGEWADVSVALLTNEDITRSILP